MRMKRSVSIIFLLLAKSDYERKQSLAAEA